MDRLCLSWERLWLEECLWQTDVDHSCILAGQRAFSKSMPQQRWQDSPSCSRVIQCTRKLRRGLVFGDRHGHWRQSYPLAECSSFSGGRRLDIHAFSGGGSFDIILPYRPRTLELLIVRLKRIKFSSSATICCYESSQHPNVENATQTKNAHKKGMVCYTTCIVSLSGFVYTNFRCKSIVIIIAFFCPHRKNPLLLFARVCFLVIH